MRLKFAIFFDEEVVKKEKSCLNGKTYSSKTILSFVDEVTSWAKNRADITLNETLVKKIYAIGFR